MNALQSAETPADQQAIANVRAVIDQLSAAGRRKLLALLARKSLPAGGGDVSLATDDGEVFAYLYSVRRPTYDFTGDFTKEESEAIARNLFDPKNSTTLKELLARLETEDGRTAAPSQP
jgi:hypothetical protein